MTRIIGRTYDLAMLFFFLAFLVTWFRSRKQVRRYEEYGIQAGKVLIAFEVLVLLPVGPAAWSSMPLLDIIVIDAVAFVRVVAYTVVGIHMCALLGYRSFPLLKPEMEMPDLAEIADAGGKHVSASGHTGREQQPAVAGALSTAGVEGRGAPLQTIEIGQQQPLPFTSNARAYVSIILAVVVGAVGYSALLFSLTSPQASDIMKLKFGESSPGTDNVVSLRGLAALLEFSFVEEILFRLGIQNYLANQLNWRGRKYWLAITLAAALWTLAHTGVLEPDWVKLVQIFPVGLALGWLFRKLGTESCVLAHSLFNVTMLFVSPLVLR